VLGIASVVVIVIRIASPPDLSHTGVHVSDLQNGRDGGIEVVRQVGVWFGLIAAAAVAYGGTAALRTTAGSRAGAASPG
jgi:hypothetical protein